jgi:hypothetical protein
MGKLSAKQRKKLPKKDFADRKFDPIIPEVVPDSGSYPVPDESHARNALARVSQVGSPKEKGKVRKKVAAKFPAVLQFSRRNKAGSFVTITRKRDD